METIRLGARLRAARKAAGYKTSKNFLRESKIPASTYSQHESGARIPDDKSLKYYSKIFAVDFNWLKNGKGLPYSHTKKTTKILEEELLDLNKFKPNPSIDKSILTTILQELLSAHINKISYQMVQKIAVCIIHIHETIISANVSNKDQIKLLKRTIKQYKDEFKI